MNIKFSLKRFSKIAVFGAGAFLLLFPSAFKALAETDYSDSPNGIYIDMVLPQVSSFEAILEKLHTDLPSATADMDSAHKKLEDAKSAIDRFAYNEQLDTEEQNNFRQDFLTASNDVRDAGRDIALAKKEIENANAQNKPASQVQKDTVAPTAENSSNNVSATTDTNSTSTSGSASVGGGSSSNDSPTSSTGTVDIVPSGINSSDSTSPVTGNGATASDAGGGLSSTPSADNTNISNSIPSVGGSSSNISSTQNTEIVPTQVEQPTTTPEDISPVAQAQQQAGLAIFSGETPQNAIWLFLMCVAFVVGLGIVVMISRGIYYHRRFRQICAYVAAVLIIFAFSFLAYIYADFTSATERLANDVIGQLQSNATITPNYTSSLLNNGNGASGVSAAGLRGPFLSALDPLNHRLFQVDANNNRVLEYDLDSNDLPIDAIADHVLGQQDFTTSSVSGTTASNMLSPLGVAYDPVHNYLFVGDGNAKHRILVFNVDPNINYNGEAASFVLGQTTFTSSAPQSGAMEIENPYGLTYDPTTGYLFVSEFHLCTVSIFNLSGGITNGMSAIHILGAPDFSHSPTCPGDVGAGGAVTASTLYHPRSTVYDPTTHLLYLVDTEDNRVLVFDLSTMSNVQDNTFDGASATYVLGQQDFVSSLSGTSATTLASPYGADLDTTHHLLYVSDSANNRIVAYDTNSLSIGMTASYVIGQSDFNSNTGGTTQTTFSSPINVKYDSTTGELYITDFTNNRVLVYNVSNPAAPVGAIDIIGQNSISYTLGNTPLYTQGDTNSDEVLVNSTGFSSPRGVALDSVNHRLFVADTNNNRVLVFNLDSSNNLVDYIADYVLGQSGFTTNAVGISASGMRRPEGLAYDSVNNRLFVFDSGNTRVLEYNFNTIPIASGMNATHVLGKANFFTGTSPSATQSAIKSTGTGAGDGQIAYDVANKRLFVVDRGACRVLAFNVDPATIANGETASNVLGHTLYNNSTCTTTTSSTFITPYGLAYDSVGKFLYLSDINANRILKFDANPSTIANGEVASSILGGTSGTTASTFNMLSGLSYDSVTNRLFADDTTNNRVLAFDTTVPFSGSTSAVAVIGQDGFTSNTSGTSQTTLMLPYGSAIDATLRRLYIGDTSNHRVLMFGLPNLPATTISSPAYLGNLYSQTLPVDNSQGNVSYSLVSGALPDGITLGATGFSGTPTTVGTYSFVVSALDTIGTLLDSAFPSNQQSYSLTVSIPPAPAISNIVVVPTRTTADITWDTTTASSSIVAYGPTDSYGTTTPEINTAPRVTSHSVSLSGLTCGTIYNFQLSSTDAYSQTGTSSNQTFTTSDCPPLNISDISYTSSLTNVVITWSTSNIASSEVAYGTSNSYGITTPETDTAPKVASHSVNISGLTCGTTYHFQVSSTDAYSQADTSIDQIFTTTHCRGGHLIITDQCPNISGVQQNVPAGMVIDNSGNCVTPISNQSPTDVCPNISGSQSTVPTGMTLDSQGNCVNLPRLTTDVCPNISGNQTTVPNGMTVDGLGDCVNSQAGISDVCPNISGNQSVVPSGMIVDNLGNCVQAPKINKTCEQLGNCPVTATSDVVPTTSATSGDNTIISSGIMPTGDTNGITASLGNISSVFNDPKYNVGTKTIVIVGLLLGIMGTIATLVFGTPYSLPELVLIPTRIWSFLMGILGYGKRTRRWGTIYDSITKQPLDPVYVSLIDSEGVTVGNALTDLDGRYGFLVKPGHYMLRPEKTNYAFPSVALGRVTKDEIYSDIYFGNYFEIKAEGEVIAKNIPMDPINFDWNEVVKREHQLMKFYSRRNLIFVRVADFCFDVGFIIAILALVFAPHPYNIIIFVSYCILFAVKEFGINYSKLGEIVDKATGAPIPFAIMRVFSVAADTEVTHKISTEQGLFYCLVANGEYYITIEKKNPDKSYTQVFKSDKTVVKKGIIKGVWKV